jgi:hypothetical protein
VAQWFGSDGAGAYDEAAPKGIRANRYQDGSDHRKLKKYIGKRISEVKHFQDSISRCWRGQSDGTLAVGGVQHGPSIRAHIPSTYGKVVNDLGE